MRCITIVIIFMFTQGCIERFDPELDKVTTFSLVVDGLVTTEEGPHFVTVKRARPTDATFSFIPVSGARVTISDDLDNDFLLIESSSGVYQTIASDFTGEIGRSYKVRVESDGEVYESSFEKIEKAFPITAVYGNSLFDQIQTETGDVTTEPRVQIIADLSFPEDDYFARFEWEATYEVRVPLQGLSICWANPEDAPSNPDPNKRCYVSEQSSSFLRIFSNESVNGSSLDGFEIYRIDPNKRFQNNYSPLIKSYSLTPAAYKFWNEVRLLTENTGSLFDTPPTQIQGNVRNLSNTDEVVLGYFGASDVFSFREFLPPSTVTFPLDHFQEECTPEGGGISPPIPPPESCCECTFLRNRSDQPPDFWMP